MHPALKVDIGLIASYRTIAFQFLEEAGIAVGDDHYRNLQLALSSENVHEFVKVLVFIKRLFPNEDYPQGMTEKDLVQGYFEDYALIAAIGVIEQEKEFSQLSQRIAKQEATSIAQCHDYAQLYWRIRELAELLKMSDVYKASFRRRQKEIASSPRQDALGVVIAEILELNPKATMKDVLRELEKRCGIDPIESITEEGIEWFDAKGKAHTTPISGLTDRVSRLKKAKKVVAESR